MDRLKQITKYILWIALFYIFSNFLINVSLNSAYNKIEEIEVSQEIEIFQAEATSINGRIRGFLSEELISNNSEQYLKIELYSERDNILGVKYLKIADLPQNDSNMFEFFFNVHDVEGYKIEIVSERPDVKEIEDVIAELVTPEVILGVAIRLIIFF